MEKIILLACISLFFLGCGNFLDINPESEVVNDDMFSTAEGVEDALYGVYMSMVKEDMYGGDMSVLFPEILAQNFLTDEGYWIYLSRLDYSDVYARVSCKDTPVRLSSPRKAASLGGGGSSPAAASRPTKMGRS